MAVAQGPLLVTVLLLVSSGFHWSSPSPVCQESCTCQAPLLNCSSSGLSSVPQPIQDSVTDLDLSHNFLDSVTLHQPHRNLRNVWLGNNTITYLSLCIERNLGTQSVRGTHPHRLRPWSRRRCVPWAPTLQLLSIERNQLVQLPEGLEGVSLRVLQLSHNRISTLRPGDLSHLPQLRELYLQHNLITSLHPQIFQDLAQLKVLDLSFNMLTSIHPLMYLSLRNIGADVRLEGNRWQCDCNMRSLKRWITYDSNRGMQAWSMVCSFPSVLSGKDLQQLEDDDLNCFGTENEPALHQDVTVYSGSEILLSCSAQDSTWWTPTGQASVSQPQADLLISDVTERDTGLYVCMSREHEVISVFNLQISRIGGARRRTRSLPRANQQVILQGTAHRIGEERNQTATQSDLTLAVCLSVFITFLIAFILGVLARPCIDVLWTKVTKKKSHSATNSASSTEQRQYENEAYAGDDEPEEVVTHRERRVTFSTVDFIPEGNMQYYDTVASQESISNGAVNQYEEMAKDNNHTTGDSGSEHSLQQNSLEDNQKDGRDLSGVSDAEFERIPRHVDLDKRRSLSSNSDSSLTDTASNEKQMTPRDHTTPKSTQLAEDSVQQRVDCLTSREVEVPQISTEDRNETLGFSSEPFSDWSPNTKNANSDVWQENEEQFEFSDSVRSESARSSGVFGSPNDSKLIVVPTLNKQNRGDMSSSSSYMSEGEPTQYTVNSDHDAEDHHFQGADAIRPSVELKRPEHSFSSNSSDSDGDVRKEKVKPKSLTKWRGVSLGVTSLSKNQDASALSPSTAYSSTSSSESEAEITGSLHVKAPSTTYHVREHDPQDVLTSQLPLQDSEATSTSDTRWPVLDLEHTKCLKNRLDIKAPSPSTNASSSSDSESETARIDSDAQWPAVDLDHIPHVKGRLDIKAPLFPTNSSSSSDSENEETNYIREQGKIHKERLPVKISQTVNHDLKTQWPTLDLDHTIRIKRRLDIKAPSPGSDSSSSSDSENEETNSRKEQEHREIHKERLPVKVSPTVSHDPKTQGPVLDLDHTKRIKRRLDIKAPSPGSDSSSSSDSENEETNYTSEQGKIHKERLPVKVSPTVSHDPKTQWPVLDLEHTMRIKRRLDIKAPSPGSDSSSSSDNENEETNYTKEQEHREIHTERFPVKVSPTVSHDPKAQWPTLDLEHTTHIKRRLDIKAPSPGSDSSSSSDSENEETNYTSEQGKIHKERLPVKVSPTVSHDPKTQGPVLDLDHTKRIKRRLDIKAPSPGSDSSSSSDSENEETNYTSEQGKIHKERLPVKVSPTVSHDLKTQWPTLDLEHTMRVKRRLDIKAPSPGSDSSSSSDSENEETNSRKEQEHREIHTERFPVKISPTVSHDPKAQWPILDLDHTKRIKRRLDIKAPSPGSDSSSSSDSENEETNYTSEQGKIHKERLPVKVSPTVSHDPKTQGPVLDLDHTKRIKRRLDIKAPSPGSDSSSSSDSENEETNYTSEQGKIHKERLPVKVSPTVSHDPKTQWPVLDLEHTMRIKRRLDIKAPSPGSDSSSSSDNENEETNYTKEQEHREIHTERFPVKVSPTVSHDPKAQWPTLDLEHTTRIKRRLDIKAPSPGSDSSSSSDSENEETNYTSEQGKIHKERLPVKVSPTVSHDPKAQWPILDLDHTKRIKRRLDIKAPSPDSDSSSSSDSENEETNYTSEQWKIHKERLPVKVSPTVSHDLKTQWPTLDLEHTMRIKRRLDIKAPSPGSDSSSSSDSENKETNSRKEQEHREIHTERLPVKISPTVSHDPKAQWPILDLDHTKRIKRRLVIKAPSPGSDSSSSSDSENEETNSTKEQEHREIHTERLPVKISPTVSHDPKAQWPILDLDHTKRIKRRLDIKAPSPDSDSSSSSDSENEETNSRKEQEHREIHTERFPVKISPTVSHDPKAQWPILDLDHTKRIKRRLDIKAPSPGSDSSSSSDSENEETNYTSEQGKIHKERLPVKVSPTVSHDLKTQWPTLDLEHTKRIKRRLDIKAPTQQPDLVHSSITVGSQESGLKSSTSESEDDNRNYSAKVGMVSATPKASEKDFIRSQKIPKVNISLNPKTDYSIKLEKYSVITDDLEDNPTKYTTPEINPELQSRWATMNLGISRFRKRLEISSHAPPNVPTSSPPVSPTSSSSESGTVNKSNRTRLKRRGVGMQEVISTAAPPSHLHTGNSSSSENEGAPDNRWRETSRLPVVTGKEAPKNQTSLYVTHSVDVKLDESQSGTREVERTTGVELKPQTSKVGEESDSMWPQSLTSIPRVKRALDVRTSFKKESSSSSNSEDEMTDHRVPDLNLGVPRIKRRLNIKAPSPEPNHSSSSSSESDTDVIGSSVKQSKHISDMLERTDIDSQITYKRVIIKTPLPLDNSSSPSGKSPSRDYAEMATVAQGLPFSKGDRNASFPPQRVPSTSFDDIVKKRIEQSRRTTDVDLTPTIRWTGISNTKNDEELKQYRRKTDVTLMHEDSSLSVSSVSRDSSRPLDRLDFSGGTNEILKTESEDKRERKGLSALKAMSSLRRKWDTEDTDLQGGASTLSGDHGPQSTTTLKYYKSEEVIKAAAKQPLTQLYPSSTRRTNLYPIPYYRRHNIGETQQPQKAPPPVPTTLPPDEAKWNISTDQ